MIHLHRESPVAHCGLIINTGGRDELPDEHGMAHFIEHVIFKGTGKRKLYHILSRMEDVGGDLDAYTTKEDTWIYAAFLNQHYERCMELISDIVFNSIFPAKEVEKEKVVVIDEINSYRDVPADLIYDDFEDMVFAGHPLGRSILGCEESVSSFGIADIRRFIDRTYTTNQMIVCSVGSLDFGKLCRIFEKHFSHHRTKERTSSRKKFRSYKPVEKIVNHDTHQAHCIIGNVAYGSLHPSRLGLLLLSNILGGPGMNSRLNLSLREKYGLVYHVESSYTRYTDTGLWNIYFGTDKENLDKCNELIRKELQFLKKNCLGTMQLHRAKQQMKGQIAISSDSNANLLFTFGKSYLLYNKVDSLEKVFSMIDELESEKLAGIANEIFDESMISKLIYL